MKQAYGFDRVGILLNFFRGVRDDADIQAADEKTVVRRIADFGVFQQAHQFMIRGGADGCGERFFAAGFFCGDWVRLGY
ncbi:hypothetical protein D3C76_1333990 [compost metagenome]